MNNTQIFAQDSWVLMLPDLGYPVIMIRTNDNKYLALALLDEPGRPYTKLGLYKCYDHTIEWSKYYTWQDSGSFSPNLGFIQLHDGRFLISGKLKWKPFLALFDENGDTLWVRRYDNYPNSNSFNNPVDIFEDSCILLTGGGLPDNLYCIHTIDYNGNIIAIDSSGIPASLPISFGKMKRINTDTLLFSSDGKIILTDFTRNIYKQVEYDISPKLIIRDYDNGYLIVDNVFYDPVAQTNNGRGIVKLNSNLDSIISIPASQYYGLGGIMTSPNDMIITNDHGIALCGGLNFYYQDMPYLIKTDHNGNSSIIEAYSGVVPDASVSIFQDDDSSFIMFQGNILSAQGKLFIVKTNIDGTIGAINMLHKGQSIRVFPNPVDMLLNIEFDEKINGIVSVLDIDGVELYTAEINNTSLCIDMGDCRPGMYIVKIYNDIGFVITEKVVKY